MADVFVEHMISKKTDGVTRLKRIGLWALILLLLLVVVPLSFLLAPQFAFIVFPLAALAVWGLTIVNRRMNVEYEYILTNGELDIDAIMGRSRRKRQLSVDCRSFDMMAPVKPDYKREFESQSIRKRLDFSSSPHAESRYFAVYNGKDGLRTLLIFEPNNVMRDALRSLLRNRFRDA